MIFYEQPWYWRCNEFDPDYESSWLRACTVSDQQIEAQAELLNEQ